MNTLHPDLQTLIDARSDLPAAVTIEDERRNWTTYSQRLAQPAPDDMVVEDCHLPTSVRAVPVRVYRPAALGDDVESPCVIYLHGGGFMKGDLDSSDSIAWGFAELARAVVVSVDYRLTPEHPYPAAFDDAYSVLEYVAGNAKAMGIDPARVAVSGDSAGGNLAAAMCLASRDRSGPTVVAQALVTRVPDSIKTPVPTSKTPKRSASARPPRCAIESSICPTVRTPPIRMPGR